jgi:hypothetical protein
MDSGQQTVATRAQRRRDDRLRGPIGALGLGPAIVEVDSLGMSLELKRDVIRRVKAGTLTPGYLIGVGSDPKTVKGEQYGYLTGIQYLTPADGSGVANLCPFASSGCKAVCLNTAGHGDPRLGNTVQLARLTRTAYWQYQRSAYWAQLIKEIDSLIRKANRLGVIPVIRLNGTSDIVWERTPVVIDGVTLAPNIMALYPELRFYDYTKWSYAKRDKLPDNYHLTYSRSEDNHDEAMHNLEMGRNVTVVFGVKKGDALPESWNGYQVIDADLSDLRFLDDRPVICGLRAKGYGRTDDSGFIVQV